MEVELNTAQELVWKFTTELDSGGSSCNLCDVTFQTQLTNDIENHILQDHGAAEEVIELKEFVESSTNFVTINKGKKDFLSTSPITDVKEPERLSSPVWKFTTLIKEEEIS